jgi:hypothetical protein
VCRRGQSAASAMWARSYTRSGRRKSRRVYWLCTSQFEDVGMSANEARALLDVGVAVPSRARAQSRAGALRFSIRSCSLQPG